MKKIVLRILSMVIIFALVLTCCAACGEKVTTSDADMAGNNDDFFTDTENIISVAEESADKNGSQSNDAELSGANNIEGKDWKSVLKSMPAKLKGSTLEVVNWNPMSEYAGANDAIKDFENATNIKVKWSVIEYSVYFTRLAARIATNDAPDVCRTMTPNVMTLQNFQPISSTGYDFSDKAWDQNVMNSYTVNGKSYATSLKGTHVASPIMVFYNKSLVKKYDLEDPYKLWKSGKWNWDKLLEIGEDFRKASGAEWAISSSNYDPFLPAFGVQGPVEFDGKEYKSIIKTEKYIKTMQTITNLHTGTGFLKHWDTNGFDNGDGLFMVGTSVYARRKNSYFASLKNSGALGTVPFPAIDGQGYIQNMGEYEAYAVAKGAENATAVPYFLRYFLDPANYDMKSFFIDNQALEVHNWCMSQKNTSWPTYNGGIADFTDDFAKIFNTASEQVKNFVDSNASVIDERVKTYNETIKKLN